MITYSDWSREMRDQHFLNTGFYVWDYSENRIGGRPLNVVDVAMTKLTKLLFYAV